MSSKKLSESKGESWPAISLLFTVNDNAEQLFLPVRRDNEEGIILSLGELYLCSWFEEAAMRECQDKKI